jgi:hypothetical protein
VVLKRLALERDGDQSVLTSFVREAEIAARIAHPNVVQIFDLGDEPRPASQGGGQDWFLAMEYLDGRDMLQVGRVVHSYDAARELPPTETRLTPAEQQSQFALFCFTGVPLVVGNIGPATFGRDDNTLVLVDAQGERELPPGDKLDLARQLVGEIARRLPASTA